MEVFAKPQAMALRGRVCWYGWVWALLLAIVIPMNTVIAADTSFEIDLPPEGELLATLREGHPRVLATAADFERLRDLVKRDPEVKRVYEQLRERGLRQLDQPVTRFHLRDGARLLYESRDVLDRALTLSMLYQIDGERRWLDRIWRDMEAAAEFEHWHPNHFLDVAEMATAFALAYDWNHDAWTPEQRQTMRDAIIQHGIKPALAAYHGDTTYSKMIWWRDATHNWNQVCNGGITLASLAIADEEPQLAAEAIREAVSRVPAAMALYAPDGGYMEGPTYWSYGTSYNVLLLAALDSTLGSDFGLSEATGFDVTGGFPVHMTGPLDRTFNFADAPDRVINDASLMWLAQRYDQPA